MTINYKMNKADYATIKFCVEKNKKLLKEGKKIIKTIIPHIFQTFDYSIFKDLKGNRIINDSNLKGIIKSVEEDGYSPNLVQVNEHMEVIDGNHRLGVHQYLKIPISYYMVVGAGIEDTTIMNTHRKSWSFDDWLNRFYVHNYEEYKIYKHLKDKWKFDHWSCIFLLCRTKGVRGRGKLKKSFETGKLKIETLEEGKKWAQRILDIKPYYKGYDKRSFVQAMIRVFHDKDYNHKIFIKKLSLVRDRMYDCSTVGLYIQRIDDVMNYQQPKNKRTMFAQKWGDADAIFRERRV